MRMTMLSVARARMFSMWQRYHQLVYGLVALTKLQEVEMEVAEYKMIRFSLGVT